MAKLKQVLQSMPLKQMVEKVEEKAEQKASEAVEKPSVGKTIASAALNLAKTAVPTALSFIPGVGPTLGKIAAGIFSANDDSWFEEFSPAGATFNELLKVESDHSERFYASNVVAGFVSHCCELNFREKIKDAQFPSILAYIREKTNNVLIDDTDQYWKCIEAVANLYAIYFTGRKYIRLATELPTNIQQLDIPIHAVNPKTLSEFRGIIDNLGDYLKVTCALPEAYVRYLRWRFGTVFLSDNTDKAGLILYDYQSRKYEAEMSDEPIPWINYDLDITDFTRDLQDHINYWKRAVTLAGRAMADIKLAYKLMNISYEVEPRHYDAKEFNLRVNKTPVYNMHKYKSNKVRLIMTSQLNMSAALQAITLSTIAADNEEGVTENLNQTLAPFEITNTFMGIYDSTVLTDDPSLIARYLQSETEEAGSGWFVISAKAFLDDSYEGFYEDSPCGCVMGYANFVDDPELGKVVQFNNGPEMDIPVKLYVSAIAFLFGEISMQEHINNLQCIIRSKVDNTPFNYFFESNPLGYDTAVITREQLDAIQRTALRNLFRGTYHYVKKEEKAEIKEDVKEVIEVLTK